MQHEQSVITRSSESVLATNKVLRNTYLLLALTFLFSTATAAFAVVTNAPMLNPLLAIVGMFGLMFLTRATANSGFGLISVFLFTGFLGYLCGPIVNTYLHQFVNGSQLVMTALGGTGIIFFALSAYALTTKKDFSYMGGFLMAGFLVAILAGFAAMFFNMPILSLFVSAAFVLLSSGIILFHTSLIINGGETNYINATVSIFIALFNIFLNLLQILGALGGQRS